MSPPLLQASIGRVQSAHRSELVLADIELRFGPGEFVVLSGPSESGKSALCRCLAGIIPLFDDDATLDGEVLLHGRALGKMRLPELAGKIGYVHNEPDNQLFCTVLEEDLAFGPCSLLLDPGEVDQRVQWALEFVGLPGFGKRTPLSLSGGEKQRAALATILALKPEVLILDRSIDQLDPEGRRDLYRKLNHLCRSEDISIILVDERLDDIESLADRIVILEAGALVYDGPLRQAPNAIFCTCPEDLQDVSPALEASLEITEETAPDNSSPAAPIISLSGVCYEYAQSRFALQDVTLDIDAGEFVALTGPNGAGKTTLVKQMNALLRPQKGQVVVHDLNTRSTSPAELARYVGTCFQDPLVRVCTQSVREEVGFALKLRKIPVDEINHRVDTVLEQLGLTRVAEAHPYRLSPGQLQCAALAAVLVNRPRILILDEPTSRLSREKRWEIMALIREVHRTGVTVIMISHDPQAVFNFSERVVRLENGRIVSDEGTAIGRPWERAGGRTLSMPAPADPWCASPPGGYSP